jgi:hypothetical protein
MVFLGALGRIVSIVTLGMPSNRTFLGLFIVELLGAPAFIYWQHQVAKGVSKPTMK